MSWEGWCGHSLWVETVSPRGMLSGQLRESIKLTRWKRFLKLKIYKALESLWFPRKEALVRTYASWAESCMDRLSWVLTHVVGGLGATQLPSGNSYSLVNSDKLSCLLSSTLVESLLLCRLWHSWAEQTYVYIFLKKSHRAGGWAKGCFPTAKGLCRTFFVTLIFKVFFSTFLFNYEIF